MLPTLPLANRDICFYIEEGNIIRLPTFLVTATAKTQLSSLQMRFRPNPNLALTLTPSSLANMYLSLLFPRCR
jgi:hypothetical protein